MRVVMMGHGRKGDDGGRERGRGEFVVREWRGWVLGIGSSMSF